MATLLSLPVELLIQILSDDCITSADLVSCRLVCRHLGEVSEQCSINYTFQVDAVNRTTWKLASHLLRNPQVGKRFKSIRVTWHRRIPRKPKTWACKWNWSDEDAQKLDYALKHVDRSDRKIYEGIISGLNSEAILPFLLLHTSNLESFDMGDASLDIMGPYVSLGEAERIYEYCTISDPERRRRRGRRGANYPGKWISSLPEDHRLNYYSFLYLYMSFNSGSLSGLSNITRLAHGCYRTGGYFDRWPANQLIRMLMLPRLEVAQFYGADVNVFPSDTSTLLERDTNFKISEKSTVKHLELLNCCFRKADYRSVAQVTGCLKSFRCILEDEEVPWEDFAYEDDVRDLFRLHNRDTLKEECIFVSRATGDDKDPIDLDKDIDHGEDDDFFYRSDDSQYYTEDEEDEEDYEDYYDEE